MKVKQLLFAAFACTVIVAGCSADTKIVERTNTSDESLVPEDVLIEKLGFRKQLAFINDDCSFNERYLNRFIPYVKHKLVADNGLLMNYLRGNDAKQNSNIYNTITFFTKQNRNHQLNTIQSVLTASTPLKRFFSYNTAVHRDFDLNHQRSGFRRKNYI